MEENYSDTEHIIRGKRNDKFQQRIKTLRTLIVVLLVFGVGLTIFSIITWNNSSNDILRSLAITGLVTIIASLIGIFGCNKCLTHLEVIKTTKMKESPGQEALLIFFYFNFVLFCSFLLFGTWCFFYQDDATAWLEAKYSDKESWENDFKGISLATVQNNIRLILTIAGILSIIVSFITFACIWFSLKISMTFETIHTIVQVQCLVIILISYLIVYAGAIAQTYYEVPQVSQAEVEYLPQVLIFTGVAMILVAFLGFLASKAESKMGLMSYTIFCVILLLNFLIFSVLLNFGSQDLQELFEVKCNEVMPFFHKNFFQSFGCMNKYVQNTTDATSLTCDKSEISTIWESNIGVDVEEQGEFYGCLNEKCCIAMISYVKGKFNFLAAFCIVAFFFTLVAIMTSQYMYKKIKKYHTRILSHRNDNTLLVFMILFTISFGFLIYFSIPNAPQAMPQPDKDTSMIKPADFYELYDLSVDRTVGIGYLNLAGWWSFERIYLFQTEGSNDNSIRAEVVIQSYPTNGEFRIVGDLSNTSIAHIDNTKGYIKLSGSIYDINITLSELEFRPGCILDKSNYLEFNLTFFRNTRILQNDTIEYGVPKRYKIELNLNSGIHRQYRAKFIEANPGATGTTNYFKDLLSTNYNDVSVSVSMPFSNKCPSQTVKVGNGGVIEFNMTILNQSIPYTLRVTAERKNYQPIVFDYFVGGYPNAERVEMGVYVFYVADTKTHNVTGRLFEAFTNNTFHNDYTITVYQGYGELNNTALTPYETIDYFGNGDYYTGFYELYDLPTGAYVAIVESQGYIKNFQRFYAFSSPPFAKQMRAFPLVENLKEGELALSLSWQYSPRDLDIHVEFIASPTTLCKCDYTMHQCGGVRYLTDTSAGGDRGADVIKFDYIGDFQYIVYVSLYKQKKDSPKATSTNTQQTEVTMPESQAQLKVFAPYYSWPVFIFDIPASPASTSLNYWSVFCFNGRDGLKNIVPLDQLTSAAPDVSTCQQYFGTPEFLAKGNTIDSDNGQQINDQQP